MELLTKDNTANASDAAKLADVLSVAGVTPEQARRMLKGEWAFCAGAASVEMPTAETRACAIGMLVAWELAKAQMGVQ